MDRFRHKQDDIKLNALGFAHVPYKFNENKIFWGEKQYSFILQKIHLLLKHRIVNIKCYPLNPHKMHVSFYKCSWNSCSWHTRVAILKRTENILNSCRKSKALFHGILFQKLVTFCQHINSGYSCN